MATQRSYLTQEDLAEYADITITDSDEADDQIAQAEELIDAFVGPQDKFIAQKFEGMASAGSTTTLTLDDRYKASYPYTDYFKGMTVEIVGGTNVGKSRNVASSDENGVLTFVSAFPSAIDNTSFYRIFQMGKFPRKSDVSVHNVATPQKYFRSIPEAVKRATAAQLQYIIEMGPKFFSTDASEKNSESIGDYSYSKGAGKGGISAMIAPKAKTLLRGILNRKGQFI